MSSKAFPWKELSFVDYLMCHLHNDTSALVKSSVLFTARPQGLKTAYFPLYSTVFLIVSTRVVQ